MPETNNNEQFIKLIHEGLSTFEVQIYNGEVNPVNKTLPEALTHITLDLRNVKKQVNFQGELLEGIKNRREIKQYFTKFITSVVSAYKLNKIVKYFSIASALAFGIKGLYSIILDIIKWLQ